MNDLEKRLARCMALALPDVPEEDIPRASASSAASWNSLATVNMITLIEEEFGYQVGDAELENFISYEMILDWLRTKNHDG